MKPLIYESVPEFDQTTQYVVQLPPEERDDCIYIGVEVRTMEQTDTPIEIYKPEPIGEIPEYTPPLTLEERVDKVESDIDEVVTVLAALEGVTLNE